MQFLFDCELVVGLLALVLVRREFGLVLYELGVGYVRDRTKTLDARARD